MSTYHAAGKFNPIELAANASENLADVKIFLRDHMESRILPSEKSEAVELLTFKSGGNFLYLQYLNDRLKTYPKDTMFTIKKLDEFPEGLSETYKDEFDRLYEVEGSEILRPTFVKMLQVAASHCDMPSPGSERPCVMVCR